MFLFNDNLIHKTSPVPIWLMRQAGRYLPEYKKIRSKMPNFLEFCYHVDYATEATLQPIERFDFDAAILFSDILVIPDAMGANVRFEEGEGPIIKKVNTASKIENLELGRVQTHLSPVFETIKKIRKNLNPNKVLIGFCGAPWTIACYMVSGKNINNFYETKKMARVEPEIFQKLIDKITDAIILMAKEQIESGINVFQIFDSWSGLLPPDEFEKYSILPTKKIVSTLKKAYPHIPIIGFPRGAGDKIVDYVNKTKINIIGCDETQNMAELARKTSNFVFQGNLDPLLLMSDDKILVEKTIKIINDMKNYKFIFNLGHGISKETNPDKVKLLVETVRKFS